jgi:hypothetical protein
VLQNTEWDSAKVLSVGPLVDRALIQSGAHFGWSAELSSTTRGVSYTSTGFDWVSVALMAHRDRPRDSRTMALLIIAQRVTLLRLAFATNASVSRGDECLSQSTSDEQRGLAAVTLALAIRANSKDDYAKAIRFCDTVVSVSRDAMANKNNDTPPCLKSNGKVIDEAEVEDADKTQLNALGSVISSHCERMPFFFVLKFSSDFRFGLKQRQMRSKSWEWAARTESDWQNGELPETAFSIWNSN